MAVDKATRNRQNAASRARYEAKAYEKITVRFKAGEGDEIRKAAEAAGVSFNAYVTDAVRERMQAGK
jgi:predicted HicB family RNase H-like nuclease